MDSWNQDQLKKMQAGGNGKLNSFLKNYGIDKYMDITDKYNSKAAEIYREVIRAEVEGRSYTPPPPSQVAAPSAGGGMRSAPSTMPSSRTGSQKNLDDWGDWGDAGGGGKQAGSKFSSGSEYTRSQLESSAANKESFFARKMQENASKPDHLPPSQGGKYVGFGSGPAPQPKAAAGVDDVTAMFSKGLTTLTHVAESAVTTAAGALKTGTASVQRSLHDKQVGEVVTQNAKVVSEKAAEVAKTGWTGLKSLYATVASSVEQAAKQHGYNVDLGAKTVAQTLEQEKFRQQMQQQASGSGRSYGGYSQMEGEDDDHHHDYSAYSLQQQQQQPANGSSGRGGGGSNTRGGGGGGSGGFSGFDGGDDNGWGNDWGGNSGGSRGGAAHKSQSMSALANQASSSPSRTRAPVSKKAADEEEEWGKW